MARSNSWAEKRGGMIRISGDLREEITFWKFLDSFQGWSKWRGDRHTDLTLATDASGFGWGAHISNELIISDLWDKEDTRPIHNLVKKTTFNQHRFHLVYSRLLRIHCYPQSLTHTCNIPNMTENEIFIVDLYGK